jgi:hypothetical protein
MGLWSFDPVEDHHHEHEGEEAGVVLGRATVGVQSFRQRYPSAENLTFLPCKNVVGGR